MEIKGTVHCFFEQSGTFKNEFIKLGIPANDYDIQNNFGETDHVIDLFAEIENAYGGGQSVFDSISCDDLIIAFFPCIYFCANNAMWFNGKSIEYKQREFNDVQMIEFVLERSKERERFYELLLKLFLVCSRNNLRLIVENPYVQPHYLRNNFPFEPKIIDNNRRLRGDYFTKPTQYWFYNCEPTYLITESIQKEKKRVQLISGSNGGLCNETRSMITKDYARNFICDFILGKVQIGTQLKMFE